METDLAERVLPIFDLTRTVRGDYRDPTLPDFTAVEWYVEQADGGYAIIGLDGDVGVFVSYMQFDDRIAAMVAKRTDHYEVEQATFDVGDEPERLALATAWLNETVSKFMLQFEPEELPTSEAVPA